MSYCCLGLLVIGVLLGIGSYIDAIEMYATFQSPLYKLATIGISVLVRNKGHTLPYFLSLLHQQNYDKKRLYLRFYCDHNSDNSLQIIKEWVKKFGSAYHEVCIIGNSTGPSFYADEESPGVWSPLRYRQVIDLRENALQYARDRWAEYLFMLDADVFLTEPNTINFLVEQGLPIAAPMLLSEGSFTNFWCVKEEEYESCNHYKSILDRNEKFLDCFEVPIVYAAVMIGLEHSASDKLTYDPLSIENITGPLDDITAFTISARRNRVEQYVCNQLLFGFITKPLHGEYSLRHNLENLLNVKLLAISHGAPLLAHDDLQKYVKYPQQTTLNAIKVFVVNLERRPDRLYLMQLSFLELGLRVEVVRAVDSRKLNKDYFKKLNLKIMPEYRDPYHKRLIKAGEVACFLSHYRIWKKIVKEGHEMSMIFEDDVRFTAYFSRRLETVLRELVGHDYELLYLGRKILSEAAERPVTAHTTKPLYTYWTIAYMLSLSGARKLLAANPLQNLLPVDEFLPIMYDQHPNEEWKAHYPKRDLKALSVSPLLVHPTHYTGMPGYVSDTEDSPIVDDAFLNRPHKRQEL